MLVSETIRDAEPDTIWKPFTIASPTLVYCHNDLYQHNILVDPKTYEVTAILDWEYSGYFPP